MREKRRRAVNTQMIYPYSYLRLAASTCPEGQIKIDKVERGRERRVDKLSDIYCRYKKGNANKETGQHLRSLNI